MSTMNPANAEIASIAHGIAKGEAHQLTNARQLAEVSRYAQSNNLYHPGFEDKLAANLKLSMEAGVYKRTSLPTPPPASLSAALRSRV